MPKPCSGTPRRLSKDWRSAYYLGSMYENGLGGLSRDVKAGEQGMGDAEAVLGFEYANGAAVCMTMRKPSSGTPKRLCTAASMLKTF
jgi:hypothetical protein